MDVYQAQVEAKLEEWSVEIDKLKRQAEQSSAEAPLEFYQQLDILSARQQDAQSLLQQLTQASGERWEELKQELDEALTALGQSFEQASSNLPQTHHEELDWVEGMAEQRDDDSEGWKEGLGHPQQDSTGWAEDLVHPEPVSMGEPEGMPESDKGGQRKIEPLLGDNLLGKLVVSLNEGRIVGKVKEFYLDQDLKMIMAIQLGREGLFNLSSEGLFHRKFILAKREDISLFGFDAILINTAQAVTNSDEVAAFNTWIALDKLKGREVNTPGGTKIGIIGDIIFDEKGHLLAFKLSRLFVAGPLAQTHKIGREVIVETGREDGIITIDLAKAEQQARMSAQLLNGSTVNS